MTTTSSTQIPALVSRLVQILDQKKARDICLLHVGEKTLIADYFLICEGTSNTHIRALCAELEYQLSLEGIAPHHIEGYTDGNWILMDFSSVVVHLFHGETRNYYHLEKLWDGAEVIDVQPLLQVDTTTPTAQA